MENSAAGSNCCELSAPLPRPSFVGVLRQEIISELQLQLFKMSRMTNHSPKTVDEACFKREVFYVGGEYVQDDDGNHTFQGQMYVEHLLPNPNKETKPFPMLFIHGGTRTGYVSPLV